MTPQPIKIFLIEDDEVDFIIIKKAFENINMLNELIRAKDGLEACEWIESGCLDSVPYVILLDLNMPRMNGIEFLEWLRNKGPEHHRKSPVVILTTSADPHDKKDAYDFCIGGYILKPVDINSFVNSMSILGKYWALCEIPSPK